MRKMSAIVICCRKTGLAIIRALASKKVPIRALCYGDDQIGSFSRHVDDSYWCPDPHNDEPGFLRFLWSLAERHADAVLFPADDASLVVLSRHREQLNARFRVVAQPWPVVRQLIEKRLTYELARRHGVPCPRIHVTRDMVEALDFAQEVGFPCLVKPSIGHAFFHRYQAKMLLVRDAAQLRTVLGELTNYDAELMLSEWIPGDDSCGVNYNSFHVDGEPVAEFTAQKLRLHPTGIGFPVAMVSKRIPDAIQLGRRMIAAFGYNGFSCMEFKRDRRDGILKLMELNGRHNHSGSLDLACGINFPYLSFQQALGDAIAVPKAGPADGVHWLDEIKDIRGLVNACRKGGAGPHRFLAPYLTRHASALGSLTDPLPALNAVAASIAVLVQRKGGMPSADHRNSAALDCATSPSETRSRLPEERSGLTP